MAASVSGFQFGQNALEDVTSPKLVLEDRKALGKSKGLLKESQILATLTTTPEISEALTPDELLEQQEDLAAADTSEAKIKVAAKLTVSNVILTIDSVAWEGANLVLQVSLQNKSYQPVRFIYSPAFDLLALTDEQGRPVRTFTDGLPGELPDDREIYKGTIQVSASDIQGAQSLNLNLTDHPDRELQFQINAIPIPPQPR